MIISRRRRLPSADAGPRLIICAGLARFHLRNIYRASARDYG